MCTKCSTGMPTMAKIFDYYEIEEGFSDNVKVQVNSIFNFSMGCSPPATSLNPNYVTGQTNIKVSAQAAYADQFNQIPGTTYMYSVEADQCLTYSWTRSTDGTPEIIFCTSCQPGYTPSLQGKKKVYTQVPYPDRVVTREDWNFTGLCVAGAANPTPSSSGCPITSSSNISNNSTVCPSCNCNVTTNTTTKTNCTSAHLLQFTLIFVLVCLMSLLI